MVHRRSKKALEKRKDIIQRWAESHGYPFIRRKHFEPGEKRFLNQIRPIPPTLSEVTRLTDKIKETLRILEGKCRICGWNAYPMALVIHHRDHNPRNNKRSNLVVLCRNCHFLVHHKEGYEECLTVEA